MVLRAEYESATYGLLLCLYINLSKYELLIKNVATWRAFSQLLRFKFPLNFPKKII